MFVPAVRAHHYVVTVEIEINLHDESLATIRTALVCTNDAFAMQLRAFKPEITILGVCLVYNLRSTHDLSSPIALCSLSLIRAPTPVTWL